MKNLLPLGSVVLLKGAKKRIMICGRIQTDTATNTQYDYSACLYPEGIINSSELLMFNNENIERIFFLGMQDEEEFAFRKYVDEKLSGEVKKENE